MASTNSTQEISNRTAVALVLGTWLAERTTYQADDVEQLPDYGREAIVRLTRMDGYVKATDGEKLGACYIPSDDTWAVAVGVLRHRRADADPFAGFPA